MQKDQTRAVNVTDLKETPIRVMAGIFVVTAILSAGVGAIAAFVFSTQAGFNSSPFQIVTNFLALDSVHLWWYITRSAGLMSYILVWLSTIWGLAISSKILDPYLERMFTFDFHEHLSLLGLGFTALHAVVLLVERFQPMSLAEVLIPFASTYRPFWTGIGIIAFYLSILVTVTFYIRSMISMKTFRVIHYLSVASYLGALLHGVYAGTDSSLMWTQYLYWGSFLSTVFLTAYWLVILWLKGEQVKSPIRA